MICPTAATPYPEVYDTNLGMSNIIQFLRQIPRPYWWAISSGILVGTSYIPFPGWALLFCYTPLWFAALQLHTERRPLKKIFFAGWLTQFILTLIGFNWIYYTASEFGNFNPLMSLLAVLGFAAGVHIYIPLALVLSIWLIRRQRIESAFAQLMILALVQALLERIWPSIFEWNLAYSLLYMRIPLFQWADTVGFWGLSTCILILQAVLGYAWLQRKHQRLQALKILSGVGILFFVFTAGGLLKEKRWSKTDETVHFAVAQGNIGNADKVQSEKKERFQSYILEHYSQLTDQQLTNVKETEIMLWPETALPIALDSAYHTRYLQQILLQKVYQWDIVLLTGAYSQSLEKKNHLGYPVVSNSVFFLSPKRILAAETYNKSALLVMGEYLPFGEQFPFLYKLFPFVGVYERGPGPNPQTVQLRAEKSITLGPQICYESLDPGFSRGLAQRGADVLFNVTNDSWFGWWAEPYQHNIMTLARGIEVRRPMVRSTNTGITSALLANGQFLQFSPINSTWTHTYEIKYLKKAPLSFYTQYGHWDWVLWLLALVFLTCRGKYVRN